MRKRSTMYEFSTFLVVSLLLLSVQEIASRSPPQTGTRRRRISNGRDVFEEQKFLIGYLINPTYGDGGSCSGSLVAPDVILTAVHCVMFELTKSIWNNKKYNPKNTAVPMLSYHGIVYTQAIDRMFLTRIDKGNEEVIDLMKGNNSVKVTHIVSPQPISFLTGVEYKQFESDIAMLILNKDLISYVRKNFPHIRKLEPVKLPTDEDNLALIALNQNMDKQCYVAGFGCSNPYGSRWHKAECEKNLTCCALVNLLAQKIKVTIAEDFHTFEKPPDLRLIANGYISPGSNRAESDLYRLLTEGKRKDSNERIQRPVTREKVQSVQQGDSGGPAFCYRNDRSVLQFGVYTSMEVSVDSEGNSFIATYPETYAVSTQHYNKWINSMLNKDRRKNALFTVDSIVPVTEEVYQRIVRVEILYTEKYRERQVYMTGILLDGQTIMLEVMPTTRTDIDVKAIKVFINSTHEEEIWNRDASADIATYHTLKSNLLENYKQKMDKFQEEYDQVYALNKRYGQKPVLARVPNHKLSVIKTTGQFMVRDGVPANRTQMLQLANELNEFEDCFLVLISGYDKQHYQFPAKLQHPFHKQKGIVEMRTVASSYHKVTTDKDYAKANGRPLLDLYDELIKQNGFGFCTHKASKKLTFIGLSTGSGYIDRNTGQAAVIMADFRERDIWVKKYIRDVPAA